MDSGLHKARPDLHETVDRWIGDHTDLVSRVADPLIIAGGELAKNNWSTFESVAQALAAGGICRRSLVVILGGGAALDAAGFAAATVHRGVQVIRFPSTTLAQGDAGIGVKNAINAMGQKNFLGTFSPPLAVVNDASLLTSLDDVHWRGGLSEAVKVALLKDPPLLDRIEALTPQLLERDLNAMEQILIDSALLHMNHIVEGGDPFEARHARPLDLGHWSAHRLESLSDWAMPHGDAVAMGLMIDLRYAVEVGRLDAGIARRVESCLANLGFPMTSRLLAEPEDVLVGLEQFRAHLGGRLTIPTITAMGVAKALHEIDTDAMRRVLSGLAAPTCS
jgi:3-dehydroquinate synthase